jgi:nitroreductase
MEVLKNRHTSREFSPKKLPDQVLSSLLWAACGVNRPDGRRTAPTAVNWQEIDVYVSTADGLWLFDAREHALKPVLAEDIRALTGRQAFVKDAPVNLIYVADFSRMGRATDDDKKLYSATDTGFISQNVYLFCASEGLATVVRGLIDRPALAKAMKLRPDQTIILAQTVGYPRQ